MFIAQNYKTNFTKSNIIIKTAFISNNFSQNLPPSESISQKFLARRVRLFAKHSLSPIGSHSSCLQVKATAKLNSPRGI